MSCFVKFPLQRPTPATFHQCTAESAASAVASPGVRSSSGASGAPSNGTPAARALGSFRMQDCGFKVQASKRGTGRVVCYLDIGIPNSYTLEASFCGAGDNAVVDSR